MLTLVLESFGPFASRYEVEIKPLTLIIGRNSVGKSMLAHLVWALSVATPAFNTLFKVFDEKGGRRYIQELIKSLEDREPVRAKEALEGALLLLAEKALPQALAQSLKELLPKVYGRRLGRIVTGGHKRAIIEVKSWLGGGFRFVIDAEKEAISAEIVEHLIESIRCTIERLVNIDEERGALIIGGETWFAERIRTIADVYSELPTLLGLMMRSVFEPPVFATRESAILLVDGRAGVLRTLLRPFTAMLSEALFPDQEFIAYYYMLAERLADSMDSLKAAKSFMRELGFDLELRMEAGVYNVYAKMWSGEVVPVALAPSGIRESVALVVALTAPNTPSLVVVEEPEAHLHPRAQVLLAELMARAVASGRKWVVATTHSDYIVYELNNQVIASSTRGSGGLGPDKVAAYLVRREGGEAVIETIGVGPEGIPEEEFARVAEELATRRGFLVLRGQEEG